MKVLPPQGNRIWKFGLAVVWPGFVRPSTPLRGHGRAPIGPRPALIGSASGGGTAWMTGSSPVKAVVAGVIPNAIALAPAVAGIIDGIHLIDSRNAEGRAGHTAHIGLPKPDFGGQD